MSKRRPIPTDIELDEDAPAPAGPDRTDGSKELDFGDTIYLLFNDPAVRNYVFAAFSALAMIFLVLMQQGSDIGGLLIVVLGVGGVMFRWTGAPVIVILLLSYFLVFPLGVPDGYYVNRRLRGDWFFDPVDILTAISVLIYVAAHFRILGCVHQAVAYEGPAKRKDEPATRRPPALITSGELGILVALSTGFVILGQVVWLAVNSVAVTPTEFVPFEWVGPERTDSRFFRSTGLPPGGTRFIALVGLIFFGLLLARLLFGYWRLRMMGPAEGAMILLDTGWLETKRERSRLEKWRIWGRKRAEAKAAEAKADTGDRR